MRPDPVAHISFHSLAVRPGACWSFVEIETVAGVRGTGEATLSDREPQVREAVIALAPRVFAMPDAAPAAWRPNMPRTLPKAAACSAIEMAVSDVVARRRGEALAAALGTVRRTRIPVYANINRGVEGRTPAAVAAAARGAVAAGHDTIKLAPWDEVVATTTLDALPALLAPGLSRLAAVRAAIGSERRLFVDCHWRLNPATARYVIDAIVEHDVAWLECPIAETPANAAAIAHLRDRANRHGMLLAGMETGIGLAGFQPFIDARAYDVMMPDLKYVGGFGEALRLADALRAAGIGLSPHNPSGPVCHAASLQFCTVTEDLHSLEMQFDETPLFAALIARDLQQTIDGAIGVPHDPGLGVALDREVLARCTVDHWSARRSEPA